MKRFLVFFAIALYFLGVIGTLSASGSSEVPPTIDMNDQPRQVLAPGNPDSSIKKLSLPFSTLTFSAKGQSIKSWTFTVFDSKGRKVFEDSKLESRDRGFFGELFNIGDRPQVEIPPELTWDGTYRNPGAPEDGQLVPDGDYTYQITLLDSSGGRAQTPPFNVTVKNKKVTIDYIRATYRIFSPTGQRPFISIEQSGSRESFWEGKFIDSSGRVVRSFKWENTEDSLVYDIPPSNFIWDGKDQAGNILPEGAYTYVLQGHNRAGSQVEQTFGDPFIISSKPGLLSLTSDLKFFSPLAEGLPRVVTFKPQDSGTEGLNSWNFSISAQNNSKLSLWSQSGTNGFPNSIIFDGKNTSGQILPEGTYRAQLTAEYSSGDKVVSNSVVFDLDVTPPRGELKISDKIFGGVNRPQISLSLDGNPDLDWAVEVIDPTGKSLIKKESDKSDKFSFSFPDSNKITLEDGTYSLRASAHGRSGIPVVLTQTFRKDSRPMGVSLELSSDVMVPGKSSKGILRITPILQVTDSIEKTVFTISSKDSKVLMSRGVAGILTFWDWNGKDFQEKTLDDGTYSIDVAIHYGNGTISTNRKDILVDSKYLIDKNPQVEMTLSTKSFAPGNFDGPTELNIGIKTLEGGAPLESWNLSVVDPRGKIFRQWSGKGTPPVNTLWDGKSDSKALVESGEDYQLVIKVMDSQKRETRKQDSVTIDILVTKLGEGKYKIIVSSIQFSPYSSDLFKVTPEYLTKNGSVLRRIANALNKFPGYKIRLEGYAVSENWNNPKLAAEEQQKQLLPLSKDRAEAVRSALVLLGLDYSRFTVQGLGGASPIVPNSDLENRWKNRRVEFFLDKN